MPQDVKTALPRYFKILERKAKPRFQQAKKSGALKKKVATAQKILSRCELCERKCHVNRAEGKLGNCRVGSQPVISSAFAHFGEEKFLVPSWTIFFMGCTFHCQYCQNWSISQWFEEGIEINVEQLTHLIEKGAEAGCRNVNFVGGDPTPQLPFILAALQKVKTNLPLVWNSNFYMSAKSMNLLKGVVDVYLSDWKYGNDKCAQRLSLVKNYWSVVKRNHDLAFKDAELAIRHLVLPNHFECCTKPILEYIAKNYGKKVVVNVMGQYRSEFKAHRFPDIARPPKAEELEKAWALAEKLDLNWIR